MQPTLRLFPIVVVAAILAAPMSASAGTKSLSATMTLNNEVVTLTPKCRKSQRATGGGWQVEPPFSPSSAVRVFESRKIGQRSWRVSAAVQVAGTAKHLRAFAYCADAAKTTERSRTNAFMGALGSFFPAEAKCKSGDKARAGGFLLSPPDSTEIIDSFRTDKRTWRSRTLASTGGPHAITSYVYCADQEKPAARSASVSAGPGSMETRVLSGECKKGTKPVAGGFSQPDANPAPGGGKFLLPFESLRIGKQVQTSASQAGSTSTLTSIAYCA
jgi:hypothetical protein